MNVDRANSGIGGNGAKKALPLRYRAEYIALRALAGLFNYLPYSLALGVGGGLARLGAPVMRKRLRESENRVRAVFGDECSERRVHAIVRRAWTNFCYTLVEILRMPSVTEEFVRNVFDWSETNHFSEHIASGRGAVLALGHIGSWDMTGAAAARVGIPIFALARSQKNPLVDAYFNRVRAVSGLDTIDVYSKGIFSVVRRLKKGEVLAILPDILAKTEKVTVKFLGGMADIPPGMALFARLADVPVFPLAIVRTRKTRFRVYMLPAVYPDASLPRDEDILRITQTVMTGLDGFIRRYPDQYFWFNKKWVLR